MPCTKRAKIKVPVVAGSPTERVLTRQAAFTAQLEVVLDPAHRLATVMLRDRTAAEDAVQEAALMARRKYGQLKGGAESFTACFSSSLPTNAGWRGGAIGGRWCACLSYPPRSTHPRSWPLPATLPQTVPAGHRGLPSGAATARPSPPAGSPAPAVAG